MENTKELERAKKLFSERLSALIQNQGVQQNILADEIGVSESTVGKWLLEKALPRMGAIQKLSDYFNVPKSYFLEENYDAAATRKKGVKIPVLGYVAAGIPFEAIENVIDEEEISEEMARHGEYFGLVVQGDSMTPTINDGDIVIIRKQATAHTGDIALVMVNGDEATVKEIKIQEDGLVLIGHNPVAFPPKFFTAREVEALPVSIGGIIVELRRKFKTYSY